MHNPNERGFDISILHSITWHSVCEREKGKEKARFFAIAIAAQAKLL
jgi:hypothetical protein